MVCYSCARCGKEFDKKYNYEQHIARKTNCNGGSKTNKKIRYKCHHCHKSYSRKDTLTTHLKTCKHKPKAKTTENTVEGKNGGLIDSDINGNNNVATLTNFIKSPINIINLVVCGTDGIKNLSYDELRHLLASEENLVQVLTKSVNLNPNKPQHHNIFYSDMKSTYGEVYEDNKWVRKKIDEILETLIDAKLEDLNEILYDMNDFLNKKSRIRIRETIENFDYTRANYRKKLKTYLKPILYNHKDMIIKTRKLTKEQEEELIRKEQAEAEAELQAIEKAKPKKKIFKKKINKKKAAKK